MSARDIHPSTHRHGDPFPDSKFPISDVNDRRAGCLVAFQRSDIEDPPCTQPPHGLPPRRPCFPIRHASSVPHTIANSTTNYVNRQSMERQEIQLRQEKSVPELMCSCMCTDPYLVNNL